MGVTPREFEPRRYHLAFYLEMVRMKLPSRPKS